MDNKNEQLFELETDTRLLQFLRSKNSDRFTKLDAFCDLIGRMNEQSKNCSRVGICGCSPLSYGEFTGSISELANDWHWHRATVRSFLDGLESMGLLKRKLDGRNYIFQLRRNSGLFVPVANPDAVRDLGYLLLQHWDEYSMPADVLAKYFEEYQAILVECYKGTDLADDLAEDMAETILSAFCHLEFSVFNDLSWDDAIVQKVAATFRGSEAWSWTKWMRYLQYLDLTLLGADFPEKESLEMSDCNGGVQPDFPDSDMALLRELFYAVKKRGEQADIHSTETDTQAPSSPLPSKE